MKTLIASITLLLISSGHSATAIINFTGYTGTFTDGVDRVIGWDFTTGSTPVYLSGLSFFDAGQNGLVASHQVGVFDTATQTLVASTIIPSGTGAYLSGQFRTVDIAPVLLATNRTYTMVGTWGASTDPWVWDDGLLGVNMTGFSVSPWVTTGSTPGRFTAFSSTFSFPNSQIGDSRNWFIGPNGILSIPEPARALLVLMGLSGLTFRRRGRDLTA